MPQTQYADIYMRDFPGDTGLIPSTTRVSVAVSPDIIPAGTNPTPLYQTFYTNNYGGPYTYYSNIESGSYNYIYVRGYNLYPAAQSGTISLYYSPSSLLLVPSLWINNQISNVNGGSTANVSATATDQVVVGDAPFYWNPPPLTAGQGHYCLIGQVVTEQDPDPIPSGDSLPDFAAWVANSPGICWRNVSVVNNQTNPTFSGFQGIANTQSTPAFTTLAATCTNVPNNTSVSLICAKSGPVPPINYTGTVGPANQVGSANILATTTTLPANFDAMLQLTVVVPAGVTWPDNASITLSYYINQESDSELASIGLPASYFGFTEKDTGLAGGGVMLLLGDYTYEFNPS